MRFLPGASGGRMAHILTVFSLSLLLFGLLALSTFALPKSSPPLVTLSYTVNTTADHDDSACVTLPTGDCTLREAINLANTDGYNSEILFNIPTSDSGYTPFIGAWTIQLTSDLPTLSGTWSTRIEGSTQTSNVGNTNPYGPEIVVNGRNGYPYYNCFTISSAYNAIKGLVINQCRAGVRILGSAADFNTIAGNYIGINALGTASSGNTLWGIYIYQGSNNTIGGTTPEARNIISGNGEYGRMRVSLGS